MLLLAFDTATPAVTVALHDGARVVAERTVVDARRHGELLAPGIERVLSGAGCSASDLTQIAVGVGPGPFTGLRVGLVTARAFGDALGIGVVGVCTLDVLAAAVVRDSGPAQPFLVATDARRKEVYWATYEATGQRLAGPHVGPAAAIGWGGPAVGAGALLYPAGFETVGPPQHPAARDLAELVAAGRAAPLPAEPLYLRRPDAVEPGARKAVTPV